MSQSKLDEVLREYKKALQESLGDRLAKVMLYGSFARDEGGEGSDIDVLCVMKKAFDYSELIHKTSEASAFISLKHDVVISTAFTTVTDYEKRLTPFLMNVRREGVAV